MELENQTESPAVVWYSAYKLASNDIQTSKARLANSHRSSRLGKEYVWLVERWRPFVLQNCFFLISEVSVGRYVVWPRCCCRGCYIPGQKERKKNLGQILVHISLFTVISFDWTSLNAVSDSEGCADGTSGATFPVTGWRYFTETHPKKKKHLDCVFINGYYKI